MNNCQNHKNHHCIHSHKCDNKSHNKITNNVNKSSTKNLKHLINNNSHHNNFKTLPIISDNLQYEEQENLQYQKYQQKQLQYIVSNSQNALAIQSYIKRIDSLSLELQQKKKCLSTIDIQTRKLKQKNLHLQTQIQYLRTQLDTLVNNHNGDFKQQIKKHLKQITNLNLKIKSTSIIDKQKAIKQLSTENQSFKRNNRQLEKKIKVISNQNNILIQNNKQISLQKSVLNSKFKQQQKQFQIFKQKYNLLSQSLNSSSVTSHAQLNKLSQINQKLQKSLHKRQTQLKNIYQLNKIQNNMKQKLIQQLKSTLNIKQNQNRELMIKHKQLENNYEQINDDLKHTKQIIIKYDNITQQTQKIKKQFIDTQIKNITNIQPLKTHNILQKIENINSTHSNQLILQQKNTTLQEENIKIKSKLSNQSYESQHATVSQIKDQQAFKTSLIINEELILSIGASSEFKKIIQEKNKTIKELMREKSLLYSKIYEKELLRY